MITTSISTFVRGRGGQLAALCGALLFVWSGLAVAVGTASSTPVTNRATITYSVGGVAQTGIESSPTGNATAGVGLGADTSFVVDNKVDLLVTEGDLTYTTVAPGQTAAVTTFTVTNQGNTTQDFSLAAANLATLTPLFSLADNFDGTGCAAYVEDGTTPGGYQAVEDIATYIDELAADGSATVYVVCNIPAGQANNSFAVVSLTATALAGGAPAVQGGALTETAGADTAGVDIVFADDIGTEDGNRDAAHSARDAYLVQAAALTVTKTVALLCDPFNGPTNPKNIPGAVVRWTVTVSNAGPAAATLTQVSDVLNANSTFDPDLITGAGAGVNCEGAAGGAGTAESADGRGFRLDILGDARPGVYPKFLTTAIDGDGAELNGATVQIDYGPAMPAEGAYTAGELKSGESVTVYFNVSIN